MQQHPNLIMDLPTDFMLVAVVVMEIMQEQVDQVVAVVHQEEQVQLTQVVAVQMVLQVDAGIVTGKQITA